MTSLNSVSLVGANTNRTKAYVQVLLKNGYRFRRAYLLNLHEEELRAEAAAYSSLTLTA